MLSSRERHVLLLPSSVRDFAADRGERVLRGVGKLLLFGFEVRFAAVRSLAEALTHGLLDLLGDDLRLDVLAQVGHVRLHTAPDLGHLLSMRPGIFSLIAQAAPSTTPCCLGGPVSSGEARRWRWSWLLSWEEAPSRVECLIYLLSTPEDSLYCLP